MRILIDQSGYDLLNLGDAAMLQSCTMRLGRLLPEAELLVVCRSPARLLELDPAAITQGPSIADRRLLRQRSQRTRHGLEQIFKMTQPYIPGAGHLVGPGRTTTIAAAVRSADVVVASGGGYLADPWWWHGVGVLSVLSLAQRLGRPTAMFGQGIGPLSNRLLLHQTRRVLPRLAALGLRDGVLGPTVLDSLRLDRGLPVVTGDDALEIAIDDDCHEDRGGAIGLSLRSAPYTGLGLDSGAVVGAEVSRLARAHGVPIIALPVSRYRVGRDLDSIGACLAGVSFDEGELEDLRTPIALREATRRCRLVVTASYHAAVFALAQGIPAICLTNSAYYDGKFAGLHALFPGAVAVVHLAAPDASWELASLLEWAWDLPEAERIACRAAAKQQRQLGREFYSAFVSALDAGGAPVRESPQHSALGGPDTVAPAAAAQGRAVARKSRQAHGAPDGIDMAEATLVTEVELTEPLPTFPAIDPRTGRRHERARALVRLATEPLGLITLSLPAASIDVANAVVAKFGLDVAFRLGTVGAHLEYADGRQRLDCAGVSLNATQRAQLPWLIEREKVLAEAPPVTVVICTRNQSQNLASVLAGVCASDYPGFEVVVVDNAPRDDAVARVVAEWSHDCIPIRRVVERRPGLSWARNRGLQVADGQRVAYLDDDEIPDRYWLAELARGFSAAPDVVMVGGAILPFSLERAAERLFEEWGGHFKGRGFSPRVFDAASRDRQHPLFPLPPFVAGGNMAVERGVFLALGGFDAALGTGTPSRAGEDTAAAADVMLAGHTVVWQPSAFAYHRHHETFAALEHQLYGYGAGVTAFYTRMVLHRPSNALALISLAPRAVHVVVSRHSLRNAIGTSGAASGDATARLRAARRRGMLAGPYLYLRSRAVQHHLGEQDSRRVPRGRGRS